MCDQTAATVQPPWQSTAFPEMITRLSHVCLGTRDLEAMLAFYCDVLGCRIVHEFKNQRAERYGAFLLVNHGTFLELFQDEAVEPHRGPFRHLCFEVDDIAHITHQMRARGFPVEVCRGRTDHVLQCWITDPDGNKVEFHQYDEQAVQYPYRDRSEPHPVVSG